MNFIAAFFLITAGGRENEAFWVFSSLLSKKLDYDPLMDGFDGFFSNNFELSMKY
jgi:hypothetical protein